MSKEIVSTIGLETYQSLPPDEIVECFLHTIDLDSISHKRVLFVCEDNTRSTPIHTFFPQMFDLIHQFGSDPIVIFALGTHRPMTNDEMVAKLGISKSQSHFIPLINHNAFDDNVLDYVGDIDGVPLKVHKAVSSADTVITLGSVLPHRVVGFSGGAKMLCPGIGNKQFIDFSHWKSTTYPEEALMGKVNNPMRDLIAAQGLLIQNRYPQTTFVSLNCVTVAEAIVDLYVGSFEESYEKAAQRCREIFVKRVMSPKRILAHVDDKCTDFWQAAKAVYNCARVLDEGGEIVVHGNMREGISATHANDILEYGYSDPDTIRTLMQAGKIKNQVAASHMMRVSEHSSRVRVTLSSEHIPPSVCEKAKLGYLDPSTINPSDFDLVVQHAVDYILEKA